MKRIFLLALLIVPQLLLAQTNESKSKRFTYGFEIAKLMVTSNAYRDFTKSGTWVKLNVGYSYSQRLNLGLSAGVNTYKDCNGLATLPVEAEVKGFLFEKPNTPFAIARAGYSFERPNDGSYGTVWSLGLGYRLKIGRNARFMPIVGFNHQQVHTYVFHGTSNAFWISKEKTDPISSMYVGFRFEF
jgi:hypothetical protein